MAIQGKLSGKVAVVTGGSPGILETDVSGAACPATRRA